MNWIREHAKPLVVRANVVRDALLWLKENNPLYAHITLNHDVLDCIQLQGGLPYHIEYSDSGPMSTSTISSYAPHADAPMESGAEPTPEIPFENVIITNLDDAASPAQMRDAALRHLKNGKAFLMHGHDPSPKHDYHNTKLFPSLYPTLYPYRVGGFEDDNRHPRISMKAHARHLMNLADGRFREHPSFLFSVFNILQRREVIRRTSMRVSLASFESKAEIYARLEPDVIQRVAEKLGRGQYKFDDPNERDVVKLMRDVHMVNSDVMGSAAARLKMRNEIRAMIASLGAPSFFITINPADVYNPLVKLLAGSEIDINHLLLEHVPNYHEQATLVAKDPVLAARFFDIYMKAFFSAVMQYQKTPDDEQTPGILGVTKGYYGMVEAQGRGSLHCHMLIWLEGGLKPSEIRKRILSKPDGAFEWRLIKYLEQNISTIISADPGNIENVPSSTHHPCAVRPTFQMDGENYEDYILRRGKDLFNLSKQCQTHTHNAGCYKNYNGPPENRACRFNLNPASNVENTTVDRESGEITLCRQDGMVNPYNRSILEVMRCNTDIKFIGSGYAAHAVLYYITDYILKTQLKTHIAYNALEIALHCLNRSDSDGDVPADVRAKRILMKCANAIISKQELSAQQIASYLLGNGDNYTSHQFKEFYWKCYDLYVLHCFRGNAASSERNVLDRSEHVGSDEARVLTNHASDNYDNIDNPNDLLTDPLISCNDYVTVSVDQSGLLIPTAGCVAITSIALNACGTCVCGTS